MIRTFPWLLVASLGACHGVSDCAAGFLLGDLGREEGLAGAGALVLLYNVLAFGGQLPIGVWLDRSKRYKVAFGASLVLMALAMLVAWGLDIPQKGLVSVALAGLASGIFHVAGGAIALEMKSGDASLAGTFAGPGVMGLALGGWMAFNGTEAFLPLAGILILGMFVTRLDAGSMKENVTQNQPHRLEGHDVWMMVVMMVIALRSLVWNLWDQLVMGDHELLLAMALAAGLGKVAGGFIAMRWGIGRWMSLALAAGGALLHFGSGRPVFMLVGIALVQSATGPAISLLWRLMPRSPGTVAGMGFGLCIALGGLPMLLGWTLGLGWTLPVLIFTAIVAAFAAYKLIPKPSRTSA